MSITTRPLGSNYLLTQWEKVITVAVDIIPSPTGLAGNLNPKVESLCSFQTVGARNIESPHLSTAIDGKALRDLTYVQDWTQLQILRFFVNFAVFAVFVIFAIFVTLDRASLQPWIIRLPWTNSSHNYAVTNFTIFRKFRSFCSFRNFRNFRNFGQGFPATLDNQASLNEQWP